jgi:hypothetical protein
MTTGGQPAPIDVPTEFALPGLLGVIARITSVQIAIVVAQNLGGGKMHFGQKLPRDHVLIALVGRQAAIRIHQEFQGHGSVKIPSGKTYFNWHRVRELRRKGHSVREIAKIARLGMRRVEQLLEGFPAAEVGVAQARQSGRAKASAAADQLQGDLFR